MLSSLLELYSKTQNFTFWSSNNVTEGGLTSLSPACWSHDPKVCDILPDISLFKNNFLQWRKSLYVVVVAQSARNKNQMHAGTGQWRLEQATLSPNEPCE
jgi:hypothetical protein